MARVESQSKLWRRRAVQGLIRCWWILCNAHTAVSLESFNAVAISERKSTAICAKPDQCQAGTIVLREGTPVGSGVFNVTGEETWDLYFDGMKPAYAQVVGEHFSSFKRPKVWTVQVIKAMDIEDIYKKSKRKVDLTQRPLEIQIACSFQAIWRVFKCHLKLIPENNHTPKFKEKPVLFIREDVDTFGPAARLDQLYVDEDQPPETEQGFEIVPYTRNAQAPKWWQALQGRRSGHKRWPDYYNQEDAHCRSGYDYFKVTTRGEIFIRDEVDADGQGSNVYCLNITSKTVDNQMSWTIVTLLVENVNDNPPRFEKHVFNAVVNSAMGTWAMDSDVNDVHDHDLDQIKLDIVTGSVPDYQKYYSLIRGPDNRYHFELDVSEFRHLDGWFLFLVLRARDVSFLNTSKLSCIRRADFALIRVVKENLECADTKDNHWSQKSGAISTMGAQSEETDPIYPIFLGLIGLLCVCTLALSTLLVLEKRDSSNQLLPPTPPQSPEHPETVVEDSSAAALAEALRKKLKTEEKEEETKK